MNLNNFNTDEHDLFEIPRISFETITLKIKYYFYFLIYIINYQKLTYRL